MKGRRPVVGILDTGCWTAHPWLTGVVRDDVMLGTTPIGYTTAASDPETHGDLLGAKDGVIDSLSGHGTFIAGLVHQVCPDADIVSWRVVPSEDPIVELDLVATLSQIAQLAKDHRDSGGSKGQPLDVLNLSMGYYHESPEDVAFDPVMLGILQVLTDHGVVVVASAGNDATDRACYPAGFSQSALPIPVVSVGALNPNGTDALFTNLGGWVSTYQPGAALVSTMPPFQGGYEPVASTTYAGRTREALDPDDFRGGFGVWSGTSFSAPIAAALVAAALVDQLDEATTDAATATTLALGAVQSAFGHQ